MSAIIFVWKPHDGDVGHASLYLDDGTYISWWPDDSQKKLDLSILLTGAASSSMTIDKKAEGMKNGKPKIPDYASPPINGLNEAEISQWWQCISGRKPDDYSRARQEARVVIGGSYSLIGNNCSAMVARALMVGGLPLIYPQALLILSSNPVVTPLSLISVAEVITGTLDNQLGQLLLSAQPGGHAAETFWRTVLSNIF